MDIKGIGDPIVASAASSAATAADDATDLLLLLPLLADDDSSVFEGLDLLGVVEPAAAAAAAGAECSFPSPSDSRGVADWEETFISAGAAAAACGSCSSMAARQQEQQLLQQLQQDEEEQQRLLLQQQQELPLQQQQPCTAVGLDVAASSLTGTSRGRMQQSLPPAGHSRCVEVLLCVGKSDPEDASKLSATAVSAAAAAGCHRTAAKSYAIVSSADHGAAADADPVLPKAEPSCGSRSRLVCSVCGDHARGYNFGAVACESCKAFFRRTVQKSKVARCQFDGNCVQTVKTRRFCSACRLAECLRAGMNRHLVRGEEEKIRLRIISKCNKEKKKPVDTVQCVYPHRYASEGSSSSGPSPSELPDTTSQSAFSQLLIAMPTPNRSTDARVVAEADTDAVAVAAASELSRSQSIPAAELDELSRGRREAEVELSRQLQQLSTSAAAVEDAGLRQRCMPVLQWTQLEELGRQYSLPSRLLQQQHEDAGIAPSSKSVTLSRVQQAAAIGMDRVAQRVSSFFRRFVAFAKELPEFSRLPLKLQMHLLKAGAAAFLTIRSAELYCPAVGCWVDEGERIPFEIRNSLGGPSDSARRSLHTEMVEVIRQQLPADPDGRTDKIIVALLQVIILLSPENLLGSAAATDSSSLADVSDAQQHYIVLLRHYIEAKYSYTSAAELVPELIRLLSLCKRTAHHLSAVLLATKAIREDPLLHEILEQ